MNPPPFEIEAASASAATLGEESAHVPRLPPAAVAIAEPRVVANGYCPRDRAVRRLLAAADSLALALAFVLAFAGRPGMWSYVGWGLLTVPLCLVLYNAYGLYERDIKRISHSA